MTTSGSIINFDRFKDDEVIKQKALMNAAKGGPNSGFEIDGTEFFKEGSLTNEFPEMKDDIDLIISTEAFVAKLVDFRHRVIANRGMSRGMAHELLELVPSLESHTSPRHFTEEISGIGVEMSLEAIDFKLWGIIAAAIAFVVGLIYKFFSWMKGGDESDGAGGSVAHSADAGRKKVEENGEKMDNQQKTIEAVLDIIQHVPDKTETVEIPAVVDHTAIERSHMPEEIKERVIQATTPLGNTPPTSDNKTKPVGFDIHHVLTSLEGAGDVSNFVMNPNAYARLIYGDRTAGLDFVIASFESYDGFAQLILAKLAVLEDVVKQLKTTGDGGDFVANLKYTENLRSLDVSATFEKPMRIGGIEVTSMSDWSSKLRDTILDPSDSNPNFKDIEALLKIYDVGFKRLANVDWPKLSVLFDVIEKAKPVLDSAAENVAEISKTAHDGDQNNLAERSTKLLGMIRSLQQDLVALMKVYSAISKVYHEVTVHGAGIVKVLHSNAKRIVHFYNRFNQTPPDYLEYLVYQLEEKEKEMAQNTVGLHVMSLKDMEVRVSVNDGPEISMKNDAGVTLDQLVGRRHPNMPPE